MKTALIFGVSGQDGAYLARLLLSKNYKVYGVSRDLEANNFLNLKILNIFDDIELISATLFDFNSVLQTLKTSNPDEVYNLSGQSSVSLSFKQPIETIESIVIGTQNLLDAISFFNTEIKFYNACSTECFGDTGKTNADEKTAFKPNSPYAVAKSSAFWQVRNYRNAYNLFACSGILSNHESPLRPERFVTQKIISSACRIYNGSDEILHLGNIDIIRDWGWSPEYVEGMWLMLQAKQPDDFVIATGESHSLRSFIKKAFQNLNLNYEDYIHIDESIFRPTDSEYSYVSPKKAKKVLGWFAKTSFEELIKNLLNSKLDSTYK